MPERNRGYLRKQRLRNIERRKKLISQRELMYHGYKTLNDPDFKEGMLHKETFEDIRERLNGGNKDE